MKPRKAGTTVMRMSRIRSSLAAGRELFISLTACMHSTRRSIQMTVDTFPLGDSNFVRPHFNKYRLSDGRPETRHANYARRVTRVGKRDANTTPPQHFANCSVSATSRESGRRYSSFSLATISCAAPRGLSPNQSNSTKRAG